MSLKINRMSRRAEFLPGYPDTVDLLNVCMSTHIIVSDQLGWEDGVDPEILKGFLQVVLETWSPSIKEYEGFDNAVKSLVEVTLKELQRSN